MPETISCEQFSQFLVDQTPRYDELILEDIRPTDGWLMNFDVGTMPIGTPTEVTQDRFKSVFPNTTKTWSRTNATSCIGTPCDPTEYCIGWGSERITYYAEQQSWHTQLVCFDQNIHVTHAKEQFAQIISNILRPATSWISSNYLRKRVLQWSNKKWVANAAMSDFTYQWTLGGPDGDDEAFFDCSVAPTTVFKLVPQMLQRRWAPLMRIGYGGKNPFKETAPFVELVTDMATCWELDRLGGATGIGGTPSISGNWRFEAFEAASKYWRYGFSGQIGNFLVRVDEWGLRFQYIGATGATPTNNHRYQVILPYVNTVTSGAGGAAGIGSEDNPAYETAQFALSFISHKKGLQLLTMNATPINPEMPFGPRDFGGKWQFVMNNLTCGTDVNGNPIAVDNSRRNKGKFIADFQYYIRPLHTEFLEAILHKREASCVPEIQTCAATPGYVTQSYGSCNESCLD